MLINGKEPRRNKSINLVTLTALRISDESIAQQVFNRMGLIMKAHEYMCIASLVEALSYYNPIRLLDSFYVGYTIKQIDKEFDLLRIGENNVINIELKSSYNKGKINKQMKRNYYYLESINKRIDIFTYVSSSKTFYHYDPVTKTHDICDTSIVASKLQISSNHYEDPNVCFDVSSFLVSPFNSTNKFLEDRYFLTNHQEEIKKHIVSSTKNICSITGGPGTGKTLLVYDIAKELAKTKNVKIIHVGILNQGHLILKTHGYKIFAAKELKYDYFDVKQGDVLIIDETQRLYEKQYNEIIELISSENVRVVFSYDQGQVLSDAEKRANIGGKIASITDEENKFTLTNKIRSNANLSDFILGILNMGYPAKISLEYVNFSYFKNISDAKEYGTLLSEKGWKIINPTTSMYNLEWLDSIVIPDKPNAHTVIGQEFDNVAIIIPNSYKYSSEGKLMFSGNSYYNPEKMFYQIITRAREKIHFIIVDNLSILERIVDITKIE